MSQIVRPPVIVNSFNNPWGDRTVEGLWKRVGGRSVRDEEVYASLRDQRQRNKAKCVTWLAAALDDNWEARPTYSHEPLEHAFTLDREGFHAQGLNRPITDESLNTPTITIWGPDRATVVVPAVYSWEAIVAGLQRCGECGAQPVETKLLAFANRVCAACEPAFRRAAMQPGWCD